MNVHKFSPDDMIETSIGMMREGALEKRLMDWVDGKEIGCAREYWHEGQMVRRDVSIQLLTMPGAESATGGFFTRGVKRLLNLRKLVRRGTRNTL